MNIQPTEPLSGGRTMTIEASYEELVEKLGEPEDVSDGTDKVDVQWSVEDKHTGRKLTIWNYKNGPNYLGENGTPPEEIGGWSAGGSKGLAEDLGLY